MTRDQALAKIKKCLALAKSSNPHGAAAAMRQAQKLMAEFAVTETEVTLVDVTEVTAKAQHQTLTPWESILSSMVANAFGCEHFVKRSRALTAGYNYAMRMDYVFVGVGAAPQVAAYAYQVLSRQCGRDRLAHIRKQPKNCKPMTKTARGDEFAYGWVRGVAAKIEALANSEGNNLLIGLYMDQRHPDLKSAEVKDRAAGRNVSQNDRFQGYQAGMAAYLNRGVGGSELRTLLT